MIDDLYLAKSLISLIVHLQSFSTFKANISIISEEEQL